MGRILTGTGSIQRLTRLARFRHSTGLAPVGAGLDRFGRGLAFWTGVVLPVIYLPLLFSGLTTPRGIGMFVGLVILHVFSLRIGHGYTR